MWTQTNLPANSEPAPTFRYLVNPYGERYLHAVNGQTFAKCPAASVYQTHFGTELFAENTLYVFVGTDGGLLPAYLSARDLPAGSRYAFIELDELLALLDTPESATHSQDSLFYCTQADWLSVLKSQQLPEYAYRNAVMLIPSLGVADNYHAGYRDLWREVESNLRQLQWEYNVQLSSKVFIRRQIENLTENMTPAARLRDCCRGYTAVILAGGPSLTQFLPWVITNRDNLVVIAVSRISRLLQAAGICPDIVVSVDPNPISFDVSKEMLDFEQTLLVNGYHITPLLLGNYRGRSVYTDDAVPWQQTEDNIRSVGPTVTNTALHLAQDQGCTQIVLLGVDLCYSPEGYSHALGSLEHAAGPLVGYIGQTVTTNSGNTAETDPPFLHATKALIVQAQRAAQMRCRIVNPAPNAAAIPGIEYLGLEHLELVPITVPIRDVLATAVSDLSLADRRTHYLACRSELNNAQRTLNRIRRICRKALTLNERLHSRRNPQAKRKLDGLEQQLDSTTLTPFTKLCKIFGGDRFARLLATTDASTWSDKFIETNARDYYEAYIHGADAFEQSVKDAQERVNARLQELNARPDWQALANRWIKDRQCGRLLLRQQLFADQSQATVPPANLQTELQTNFRKECEGTDSRHLTTCLKRARLSGVIGKANEHLENKDSDALQRLIKGLNLRPEPEAVPLAALCLGYVAELSGDLDAAVEAYGQVSSGSAIEYALVRLTGIALAREDYDHALIALEHLTACSMAYAPQFAELLKLTGNATRAVDVYTEYLSLAPNDFVAMTRLGLLYRELNVVEGAQWIFEHLAAQTTTPQRRAM
jgi:tetratricopeptide (TPR) repeat protein